MELRKRSRQSGISAVNHLRHARLHPSLKSRKRFHPINRNRTAPRG
jgi:hypothetical protein